MSRLKDRYLKEVAPTLKKEFGYKNVMAIPKIEKVVIRWPDGETEERDPPALNEWVKWMRSGGAGSR